MKQLILFLLMLSCAGSAFADPVLKPDSLEQLYFRMQENPEAYSDTTVLNTLHNMVMGYVYSNIGKAEKYAHEAWDLLPGLNAEYPEAVRLQYEVRVLGTLGIVSTINRDFSKASWYFMEGLRINVDLKDSLGIIRSLNNLGSLYVYQAEYDKATASYIEGLKIAESMPGTEADKEKFYNNLSIIYDRQGHKRESLKYQYLSLEIEQRIYGEEGTALALLNLGKIYIDLNEPDSARIFLESAERISRKTGETATLAKVLNNLGLLYEKMAETDHGNPAHWRKAASYYEQSMGIPAENKEVMSTFISLHNMAVVEFELKNYPFALRLYQQAEAFGIENGLPEQLHEAYHGLAEAYAAVGNYPKAYEYQVKYTDYRDSILNESKTLAVTEMRTKYETDKQQKENRILKQANALERARVAEQQAGIRTRNILLGSSFLILLVLGGGVAVWNRMKQIRREQEIQANKLEARDQQMRAVITAQEKERSRVAKELHDGVAQLLSAAALQLRSLGNQISHAEQEKFGKTLQIIDDACSEVRSVSHQMKPRALESAGLATALEELVQKSFSGTAVHASFNRFGLENRLPEETEAVLYRVAQELINNVIKHAHASEVDVQLFKTGEFLQLMVEDNGKGIDPEKAESGMGMQNITSRVENIGGIFRIEPGPDSGTVATVRVKL